MLTATAPRLRILEWCAQVPLPCPYCSDPRRRFGPLCRDCSGMTSEAYRIAAGVITGKDTGAMARDVGAGKANWLGVTGARAGDLLLHISGLPSGLSTAGRRARYNGGPDEHVGILVLIEGGWVWTWESAGSKNGHGLYRRPIAFWQDALAYVALAGGLIPAPVEPAWENPAMQTFKVAGRFHAVWVDDLGRLQLIREMHAGRRDWDGERILDGADKVRRLVSIEQADPNTLPIISTPAEGGGLWVATPGVGWVREKLAGR